MAVPAEMGTTAACSKLRLAGLWASLSSRAAAARRRSPGSCRTPRRRAGTWSPRTRPPRPCRHIESGHPILRSAEAESHDRIRYGLPAMECQVPRSIPAAATLTSTSFPAISGRSISARTQHVARAVCVLDDGPHRDRRSLEVFRRGALHGSVGYRGHNWVHGHVDSLLCLVHLRLNGGYLSVMRRVA